MSAQSNTVGAGRYVQRIQKYAMAHKGLSAIVIATLLGGGYLAYQRMAGAATPTKYILTTVQKGTIVASVTGSGQVSASDQVTVNPRVSGQVTGVYVKDGQHVGAGQTMAQIDATNALQSVKNAQADVQSAELALQKLQKPADQLSITQAQDAIAKAQDTAQTAQTDLTKIYQTTYNDVVVTYLDLPDIITGLKDIESGTEAARGGQSNFDYYKNGTQNWDNNASTYHDNAQSAYTTALSAYNAALADYQATSQSSTSSSVESITSETYTMIQSVGTALGSANSFVTFYENLLKGHNQTPGATADTALTNLNTYITKINGHLSTLLSDTNTVQADKQQIADAQRTIVEDQQSLQKLQSGADTLDVQSAQLTIQQKQNALEQAQSNLADYTIRAPFAGVLANFNLHKGDTVGSGTAAATEISSGDIADLSLNEVDAAKISVGQKATLTFDAIPDLTLTGEIASISPLGTVSQGVVSYTVKIAFDTQDARVKAGMTVNAAIIIGTAQDALIVPSSAVKTSAGGGGLYVLVVDNPLAIATSTAGSAGITLPTVPRRAMVSTGLSNNTQTQITSGLTAGQTIVARTISGTTAPSGSTPSLIGGGGRGGGGGVLRGG